MSGTPYLKATIQQSTVEAGGLSMWFVLSAGVILAITGFAKVLSTFGSAKFLTVIDPIFGIQFRYLMVMVGVTEWLVAFFCLFKNGSRLATGLVTWLCTNFLVYRLGLSWMHWHRPCNCLGNLTDALHISPQTADNVMKAVLAYLLIGSSTLLVYQWRKAHMSTRAKPGRWIHTFAS